MGPLSPSRIDRLTTGPVLRTRAGARARVAAMTLADRWFLAWHFKLADAEPEELSRRLHDLNHKKKGGSLCPNPKARR